MCHDEASGQDMCAAAINSLGQCWGQACAYQLRDFLNRKAGDARQWLEQTAAVQAHPLQPFPYYGAHTTGLFDLASGRPLLEAHEGDATPPAGYRIAAISDWGTGTCAARSVGRLAAATSPDMTLHLGDVYYVGTADQYHTNFAGVQRSTGAEGVAFPRGRVVTFALAGNHDLISGFTGLYQAGFAYTGQQATYGVWQSDKWRVVALDTGRLSYPTQGDGVRNVAAGETDAPLPETVADWLTDVVKLGDPSDTRGIILVSHHQPYDAFGKSYLGVARQLNEILPKGKEVIWLFGHNHALAIYKKMQLEDFDFVINPRLIGIGGFPNVLRPPKRLDAMAAYDARTYQSIPDDDGVSTRVGFNGFAQLVIFGDKLDISYVTADCVRGDCVQGLSDTESTVVAMETFTIDSATGSLAHSMVHLGPELTKVNELTEEVMTASCIPMAEFADYDASLNHYD